MVPLLTAVRRAYNQGGWGPEPSWTGAHATGIILLSGRPQNASFRPCQTPQSPTKYQPRLYAQSIASKSDQATSRSVLRAYANTFG
jgi:hypothetical protein